MYIVAKRKFCEMTAGAENLSGIDLQLFVNTGGPELEKRGQLSFSQIL
jgi:hypothetical protein